MLGLLLTRSRSLTNNYNEQNWNESKYYCRNKLRGCRNSSFDCSFWIFWGSLHFHMKIIWLTESLTSNICKLYKKYVGILQYHVGCSGWSYTSWRGPFYPSSIENSRWLNYYSHIFDYVEVDSSFYRIPNLYMVKNWGKRTPKKFRFTAKFPRVITHDKRLKDVDKELEWFFDAMGPLSDKTLTLLIQLPPSLQIHEGLERLREVVRKLDNRFRSLCRCFYL